MYDVFIFGYASLLVFTFYFLLFMFPAFALFSTSLRRTLVHLIFY